MNTYQLIHGNCVAELAKLESATIDAIVSDPPYPEIDREYGRMKEDAWLEMMQAVVRESRRVLKPSGSAVFILQPNSRKVGSMRTWLWEFLVWCGKEWNIVQDVYWWNFTMPPTVHTIRTNGLMRPSVKIFVWIGNSDCYRNQENILWDAAWKKSAEKCEDRVRYYPSGHHRNEKRIADTVAERGGVTPFNMLSLATDNATGVAKHGAGTPLKLADWWVRYICPPNGTVLNPFTGSGTMGMAALSRGCNFIGIEQFDKYIPIAKQRLSETQDKIKERLL